VNSIVIERLKEQIKILVWKAKNYFFINSFNNRVIKLTFCIMDLQVNINSEQEAYVIRLFKLLILDMKLSDPFFNRYFRLNFSMLQDAKIIKE